MSTILNFKDIVDLPRWRPLATTPAINGGFPVSTLACDFRNNEDRHPIMYLINGGTSSLMGYNVKNDSWISIPGYSGSNANYGGDVIMPSQGPKGILAGGNTTTDVVISTALPSAVGTNMLANRGDGIGFKIRIIGNAAGSSGKTEERYIIANTGGGAGTTTPTITLNTPLSFVPIAGDTYQLLSGKVYLISGSNGAGGWKYFDIATSSYSGNLSTTNLPATTATCSFVGLDELYVPYDRNPGEGFFGNLVATATGAASLTGQAAGGDASVSINEHRNFQIRIVQDIATPTAVGQRRNITSHTAGPSPIYTVSAWSVQPSATATYVIENNSDRIILFMNGQSNTFTYNITANTWDTTTFANRGTNASVGVSSVQAFGIEPDPDKNARHSFIYSFRGGANISTIDLFDIAGAATGTWTLAIAFSNPPISYPSVIFGTSCTYDPATMQGRYMYINVPIVSSAPSSPQGQDYYRFDVKNRVMESYVFRKFPFTNNSEASRMGYTVFIDGNTKLSFIVHVLNGTGNVPVFGLPISR